jgi:hypothetical protein
MSSQTCLPLDGKPSARRKHRQAVGRQFLFWQPATNPRGLLDRLLIVDSDDDLWRAV